MRRIPIEPRENWRQIAEDNGFFFHHVNGEIYWDESVCYALNLEEIESGLEDPAQEIADMCLDLAADIVNSEEMLSALAIPAAFWDLIRDSWRRNEPSLYGRFDFAYDGHSALNPYTGYDDPCTAVSTLPMTGTVRPSSTSITRTPPRPSTRRPIFTGSGWRTVWRRANCRRARTNSTASRNGCARPSRPSMFPASCISPA